MATAMSQACERCWRRKQKCARDFPCQQCRAASTTCVRRRLGSIIDPLNAGAESYIEALKERIRLLQMRVDGVGIEQPEAAQIATPSSQPFHSNDTPESNDNRRPKNEVHDTMQEASYLSLSAMAERTDKQRSSIDGLSFLTLFNAAIAIDGGNPTISSNVAQPANRPSTASRKLSSVDTLITREESEAAFKTYAEFLRRTYPFMADAALQQSFETVFNAKEGATINTVIEENPDMCLITYVGIATGLLLSSHYADHENLASGLAERGKELLCHVFDQANDLAMVQCLIALTIYSMFTTKGGSTWHLLGLAMTRCIASGMHTPRISETTSDDEAKRRNARALWSLYVLDTHVSAALDRPFCLSDLDIMVSMPSSPASRSDGGAHSHLVQHAQLIRSFRKDTEPLCNFINLRHWNETQLAKGSIPSVEAARLLAQGYIELIKRPLSHVAPDMGIILEAAGSAFADYHSLFEEHLFSQGGAPTALGAMDVFAAGIILYRLMADDALRTTRIHQAINILTLLSSRYHPARGLRDVLMHCLLGSTGGAKQHNRLNELIENCEMTISEPLRNIVTGIPRP